MFSTGKTSGRFSIGPLGQRGVVFCVACIPVLIYIYLYIRRASESRRTSSLYPPLQEHFDFVEIGTSNFNSLSQEKSASTQKGISVDAISDYLSQLPNHENVFKVNSGIRGLRHVQNHVEVYYIDQQDIKQYNLPDWLVGCNSVGKPHATAWHILQIENLTSLMKSKTIPQLSLWDLLHKFGVCSVSFFKTDVEGLDGELMIGLAEFLWTYPCCDIQKISYEANELSDKNSLSSAATALESLGFMVSGQYDAGPLMTWNHTRDARKLIYSCSSDT